MNDDPATAEGEPPPAARLDWRAWTLLATLTLLALLLRLPQLRGSLWLDELHTAWAIAGGLRELPARAAIGNQSPLYFLLPWLSTQLLGMNEFAVRLPSVVAGVALVPGVFLLTWRWSASRVGATVAAVLAAIDPNFLYFSLEARPYACVQLVAVVQVFVFWSLLQSRNWRWHVAWVLLSALLFYLHYTSILLVVAEVVFLLAMIPFAKWRRRFPWMSLAVDLLAIGLLMLPATAHLMEIVGRRENWSQFISSPSHFHAWQIFPLAAFLIAPLLAFYAYLLLKRIAGAKRPLAGRSPKIVPMVLCLCWLFVPLAIAYVTTRYEIAALWIDRYVIASGAAVVVLAGLLCGFPAHKAMRIIAAIVTLAVAIFWVGPQWWWLEAGVPSIPRDEDWRGAVAFISADEEAEPWPILLRPGLIEANALLTSDDDQLREYCLFPIRSIYAVDESHVAIPLASSRPGVIADSDLEKLKGQRGIWLVTRGNSLNVDRTVAQVLHTLRKYGMKPRQQDTRAFGSVWVVRIEFANAMSRADFQVRPTHRANSR